GAHMNPAFTLTFWRLGKVSAWDAAFYSAFQFIGGVLGVLIVRLVAGPFLSHTSVNYVVTVPGVAGPWVAFMAEGAISFGLVMVVLVMTNHSALAPYTGLAAGFCVAAFIALESPFSGMSMNPARTVASALPANLWRAIWIYFTAPPLGMLLAAEVYLRFPRKVACAKLHHQNRFRCIFCEYHEARAKE
ncbi:MAG TPA: aquaporin, partial [Verrucomicrobiae bacterium]|nr:aquaporin [Verrucomicrobiae bacterium]